ncbi:MAG: C-terminal binding protein [Verrucomicrobia bacterium]|nr:C-terminal binding protein [Verrucomicrobiota bacterium]
MNEKFKIVYTDHGFESIEIERGIIESANGNLIIAQCKTAEDVIEATADADALLVQWAPVTADVIDALRQCRVIVRMGIGFDNVDIEAARQKEIPVCNVPDYCINEVADHTLAMALSLARQLHITDRRVRDGSWNIIPAGKMPAFHEMTFATVGFGRIARAVHQRARHFSFKLVAYDKFVSSESMLEQGVSFLNLDNLFEHGDIISLHCQLTDETAHLVNAARLQRMKPSSILINTARGLLVDTVALAKALKSGDIAAAGVDVFETEPLPEKHPIRSCGNALLTSHTAWYSESSVPELQKNAAEELVRGLQEKPLQNQVN